MIVVKDTLFTRVYGIEGVLFVFSGVPASAQQVNTVSEIYLDGKFGNDTNDGYSENTDVKTFDRAKQIAGENRSIKKIFVTGTVSVKGQKLSLEGTDAIIIKEQKNRDYLFKIDGKTDISDITIDGSIEGNSSFSGGGIFAYNSDINMNDGKIYNNTAYSICKMFDKYKNPVCII